MLVGYVDQCMPTLISGWAADTDAPQAIVSVVIYVDDLRLAVVACDRDRPDLGVRPDLHGQLRHGFRYDLPLALDFDRIGHIRVRHASTGGLLVDGNRPGQWLTPLVPILVTASARSGTTFLMNRLLRSPRICGAMLPPFEVRLLAYWSYAYRTLTAPADYARSTHPDRPEGDGFRVGSNPYSHQDFSRAFETKELGEEYFERFVPDATAGFIRTTIEEYYARLRDEQGKQEATFFVEKCNNVERIARSISRLFFPDMKEVVIIRDPRDILCSRIAFFHEDSELAFKHVTNSCRELLRISRAAREHEVFLKYEELIAGNPEEFEKLSDFLGVPDLAIRDTAKEGALFRGHATSGSPADSVGRWKSLPAEHVRRYNEVWDEFLAQFGYEAN